MCVCRGNTRPFCFCVYENCASSISTQVRHCWGSYRSLASSMMLPAWRFQQGTLPLKMFSKYDRFLLFTEGKKSQNAEAECLPKVPRSLTNLSNSDSRGPLDNWSDMNGSLSSLPNIRPLSTEQLTLAYEHEGYLHKIPLYWHKTNPCESFTSPWRKILKSFASACANRELE